MNLDQRKSSILLIIVYIVFIAYTTYVLFTFQDDLTHNAKALMVSELKSASPYFLKLYAAVGITFLTGLAVLFYLFNNKGMEVIYVEKKEEKKIEGAQEGESEKANEKGLDLSSIHESLTSKARTEEKLLNDSLTEICKALEAGIGAFYMLKKDGKKNVLQMNATYAMSLAESQRPTYELGEGLVGQVGMEKNSLVLDDIPEGYIKVVSGLGSASPTHVLICPVVYGSKLWGVVEIAAFTKFTKSHVEAVEKAFGVVSKKIFAKSATEKSSKKTESKAEPKSGIAKKRSKKA